MLGRSSLLCLVSILLACAPDTEQDATAIRPNVLMIVVDMLRRDHLGCYGYERDTSPHPDRFAATAVRYDRAYSQAPWTTASIGSLMTSLYPSQLGIESDRSVLHSDQVLLAEILAANGYATGAAISHTFCSSKWNFNQGFELFDESNVLGHPTDALKLQLADWADMLARTEVKRQAIELTETLSESLEAMGYAGDDE
ncbi:MAG: hypothetical protein E2O39_12300 [Planctomycetota bacterium]|nr:MAG: hypothetical protein E2O39_12300 [Planctomycetota bacterium]